MNTLHEDTIIFQASKLMQDVMLNKPLTLETQARYEMVRLCAPQELIDLVESIINAKGYLID